MRAAGPKMMVSKSIKVTTGRQGEKGKRIIDWIKKK